MLFIYRSRDIIFSNYQKAWKLTDKAQRIWIPLYFIKVVITVITVKTLLGWQKSNRKFTAFWNRMAVRKLLQEQAHDDGRTSWLTVLVVGWSMRFPLTDLLLTLGKGGDGRFFRILFCFKEEEWIYPMTENYILLSVYEIWLKKFLFSKATQLYLLLGTLAFSVPYV